MERPGSEHGLYRERPSSSSYIEHWIEKIERVESGADKLNISEEDMAEILSEENELGEKLEEIYNTKVKELKLNTDYFLTSDGKERLAEILETTPDKIPVTESALIKFIYENNEKFAKLDPETRKKLSGDALIYEKKRLQEELEKRYQENSDFSVENIKISERIGLVLNPETLEKKDSALRDLKSDIKKRLAEIQENKNTTDKEQGQIEIYKMYLQRINVLITNDYPYKFFIAKKASNLGVENMTETEKGLIKANGSSYWGETSERRESHATRIDKFVRGAEPIELSDSGPWRQQLSRELSIYISQIDVLWLENEERKYLALKEKGIDPEKALDDKEISPEVRLKKIKELYAEMGLLSSDHVYDIDRAGPAEDNKWQVESMPGRKSHSINDKQKAHLMPDNSCEAVKHITVDLGHEPVHVIQHENKSALIPLRLFSQIGGGRHSIFTEGGAKMVESELSLEIFGYENIPHPHYARAIQERVKGGDYRDTIKAFFRSAIRPYEKLKGAGEITQEEFDKKMSFNMKLAIDRCRRLFRGGGELDSNSGLITSTGSMVYIEQKALFEKVKGTPLESIFFIAGVNLENYYRLSKLGLINSERIIKPDLKRPREEWSMIRDKYRLEQPTS